MYVSLCCFGHKVIYDKWEISFSETCLHVYAYSQFCILCDYLFAPQSLVAPPLSITRSALLRIMVYFRAKVNLLSEKTVCVSVGLCVCVRVCVCVCMFVLLWNIIVRTVL